MKPTFAPNSLPVKALALLLCLFLLTGALSPALAQSPLSVEEEVSADFPRSITFKLAAAGENPIVKVVLRYRLERVSCFEQIIERHPDFTPGQQVEASWTWDMRKAWGLPPGAGLSYEWIVIDSQGNQAVTPSRPFRFEDSRYPWRNITAGKITLYWYEGDAAFAGQLLAAALKAMDRLSADTGIEINREVGLYIYADTAALHGARIFPRQWEGGIAFEDYGVMLIGVSPAQLDWGKRAVAHELAHIAVYQAAFGCYLELPAWLNEGLAQFAEGEMGASFASRLEAAIREDRLIPVRSLASSFPTDPEPALLSYAQSQSLVEFLVGSYGREQVLRLLKVFQQGNTPDDALRQVYGFDMDGLEAVWRADIGAAAPAVATPAPAAGIPDPPPDPLPDPAPAPAPAGGGLPGIWIALAGLLAVLLGVGLLRFRKRRRGPG